MVTRYGGGTPGYRAPELLHSLQYTNKVDVFAIGCILFELFTDGLKAFKNEFEVDQYYRSSNRSWIPPLRTRIPEVFRQGTLPSDFGPTDSTLLQRLLDGDHNLRPSCETLSLEFASNRWVSFGNAGHEHNDWQLAIEAYQKASDTFTVHPSIWKRLGNAYHLSGAYPEAISAYDRARAEGYQDPIEFYDIAIERACRESGAGEEKEYENDDNDEDECNETEVVESRRARWKARLGAFRVHIAVTISKEVKK